MSKILLQNTIEEHPDDWDIARFSMLADELRRAGHDVVARNRAKRGVDDPVLSRLDELDYDQLWLMAVDVGDGLTDAEADAIMATRTPRQSPCPTITPVPTATISRCSSMVLCMNCCTPT
jgi:hypothetical protein